MIEREGVSDSSRVSDLIRGAGRGDAQAMDELFPLVYEELKRVARRQLRGEGGLTTLCTTELVHEAFLKLSRGVDGVWERRAHFFGAASRAMREVLVDLARRRRATKRGGMWTRTTLVDGHAALQIDLDELIALDGALDRLNAVEPRLRQVVELRFFGGLSDADVAHVLGLSERTVERDWRKARLVLMRELESHQATPATHSRSQRATSLPPHAPVEQ